MQGEKKKKSKGGWGINLCRVGAATIALYFIAAAIWPSLATTTIRGNWLTVSSALIIAGLVLNRKGK